MIEIRFNFLRRAFVLFSMRDQKPVGRVFRQYKHAVLAKAWLESEI